MSGTMVAYMLGGGCVTALVLILFRLIDIEHLLKERLKGD